jgi:membrane associated rhomboid family serine protease
MIFIVPFRTDRPRIRPAYATITLIVICTLVQVWSWFAPEVPMPVTLGSGTVIVPQPAPIAQFGLRANDASLLTFLAHQFVHGGLLHLASNILFLWLFGSLIEDALRPWGFLALFLGGGFMAGLAHLGISQALGHAGDVPLVGASGAIAAIMGLFMLRFYRTRVEVFYFVFIFLRGTFWVRSAWALAFWISLEVLSAVLDALASGGGGGVAHWAHVGGFAAGAFAAPFLGSYSAAKQEYITDDPETNVEYVKRGEHVAAAEKALRADAGNAYLMRRLAQAYQHAGEYERATETYQRCVYRFASRGMMDQAAEVYLELLDYNDAPSLPAETLLKLAQHLESARLQQAAAAYHNLAENHPTRPEAEYALLRLAAIYHGSYGRPYDAARFLYEFLQRYPQSRWAGEARASYESLLAQLQETS